MPRTTTTGEDEMVLPRLYYAIGVIDGQMAGVP